MDKINIKQQNKNEKRTGNTLKQAGKTKKTNKTRIRTLKEMRPNRKQKNRISEFQDK